eukprot:837413-Pelagomonas_calceolata.AAC.1
MRALQSQDEVRGPGSSENAAEGAGRGKARGSQGAGAVEREGIWMMGVSRSREPERGAKMHNFDLAVKCARNTLALA